MFNIRGIYFSDTRDVRLVAEYGDGTKVVGAFN